MNYLLCEKWGEYTDDRVTVQLSGKTWGGLPVAVIGENMHIRVLFI